MNIGIAGALTNAHTLTGVESFTVDAGDNIFLDVRALMRDGAAGDFATDPFHVVNVDRIAAGDDADVLLRSAYLQTGEGESGGVVVRHRGVPANEYEFTYYTSFEKALPPPSQSPIGVSRGAYGTGTTEIATTYDFRGLDTDGNRTPAGLQSGGVSGDGNVNVVAAGADPGDTRINVLALVEVATTGPDVGEGHISVLTNGWIALTEITGDFRVGEIRSTANDVLLYSPQRFIDAQGDDNLAGADVSGRNITMIAASSFVNPNPGEVPGEVINPTIAPSGLVGGVGRTGNFLEIDVDNRNLGQGVLRAYDTTATSSQGIFLDEVAGDLRIHTVHTINDVSLRTVNGSIIDARNDDDANVIGLTVDLDANGVNASIGENGDDLEIDSRAGLAREGSLTVATDDVALEATRNIWVTEVAGELRLALAHAYLGNIVLTVRESAAQGEDLQLIRDGSARFAEDNGTAPGNHVDALRPLPHGLILAEEGSVTLRVGDDIETHANAAIVAGRFIDIYGDHDNADDGFGTDIILRGQIIAGAVMVVAGSRAPGTPDGTSADRPIGTWRPDDSATNVTSSDRLTRVFGNSDSDTFQFGDADGAAGGTTWGDAGYIFLGSRTKTYGSDVTSFAPHEADPAARNDGEDSFRVYFLQDMAAQTSPAIGTVGFVTDQYTTGAAQLDFTYGMSVLAEHTLTLDGQSDTDSYEVHTLGSQGDERNYIVNVLDTGEEFDGVDTLDIFGHDGEDDIFLLRAVAFLPNEVADRPGYVALLHGTIDEYQDVITGNETSAKVQRVSYDTGTNGRLTVEGRGGDDQFYSDDVTVIATLDGGAGDDTFQIGQIFGSNRSEADGNLLPQDEFPGLRPTTRGWLSNGSSAPLLAQGGTGNDEFRVYSNQAELRLEGDDGFGHGFLRQSRALFPTGTGVEHD